ncbi:phosphatase [Bacillus velezensis]|uniref:Phosphatase n=1 Tax=Bacillus velezensis TaxID=492670 RepID=A0ABC8D127_BACVE|nr:phosphatase [Bacillus velezensis]AWX70819.1 phosphatase [Bacillus velezensis]
MKISRVILAVVVLTSVLSLSNFDIGTNGEPIKIASDRVAA